MSATLSQPQIAANVTANLTSTSGAAGNTSNVQDASASNLTVGSSAGQVNKIYSAALTIADNVTPQVIDLTSVTDPLGNSITFAKVYVIKVTNTSTTAGQDITVGGGTTPIIVASEPILGGTDPGCQLHKFGSAMKVVDSTHKLLKLVTAAGTNVVVNVTVIGQ